MTGPEDLDRLADAIDMGDESWFWPVGGEKVDVADVLRDLQATRAERDSLLSAARRVPELEAENRELRNRRCRAGAAPAADSLAARLEAVKRVEAMLREWADWNKELPQTQYRDGQITGYLAGADALAAALSSSPVEAQQ